MITAQRTRRMQSFRCSRRGAIIVLIALLLPVLLIFCGGAVDLAIMQNARTELQAAADLSAKAAAARLSLTGSTSQAIAAGQQVAAANHVSGKPLALSAADFLFGRAERQPSGQWTFTTGQTPFNSVQVTGRRTTGATNGPGALPFGGV